MMNKFILEKSSDRISHAHLIKELIHMDYQRVPLVTMRGQFSVRGDIVDIYGQNHSHPVRIEYFGDVIEDVRSFDIHTQCSISKLTQVSLIPVDSHSLIFSRTQDTTGASLAVVAQFRENDYVVHENHGIAVFRGLTHLATSTIEGEYLLLEYRGNDRVFVPLDQINLLHRYDEAGVIPQLSALTDNQWHQTKQKAQKATHNIARDLLTLYKLRTSKQGHAFSADSVWQIDLENTFLHQETQDQKKVIQDVKKDMESPWPMDRLICGDVGFGKTEIALRAAFKASTEGKQVALLVPTTVLAQQHYRNFVDRFKSFGLLVEVISRFKTPREQKEILLRLKQGKIDVIIGTHRLIQKDVEFKDLGLLIIDEEHRFGVVHKEKLKKFRQTVDVLTMTATPIPRTLYMSLSGIRDISVINSPPQGREPVATVVLPYDEELIKEAIRKEVGRGGQVYFLSNDVSKLDLVALKLKRLVPGAKFGVAHGQMGAHQLEKVMLDFLERRFDVLICSTIIESGLDITNVNTIIIIDADRFGLSQLHQLRGRVGRTTRNAYAYLFHAATKPLTKEAIQRFEALTQFSSLGAGFNLAMKDLQIRGAGNILGAEQHGNMVAIGFELYCKLLEDAISKARGDIVRATRPMPIGKMHIPSSYIEDHQQKISIYQRLFNAQEPVTINAIRLELTDRFGPIPSEVNALLEFLKRQLTE